MDYLKNISFGILLFLIGSIFTFLGLSGGFSVNNYSFLVEDMWARIVSSIFGVVLVGIAIYIEKRKTPDNGSTIQVTEIKEQTPIFTATKDNPEFPSAKFIRLSEQKFLKEIDLTKIKKLSVLSHTGRRIYDEVHEQLEHLMRDGKNFEGEIRILTRTPFVEGLYRNSFIYSTLTKIKAFRLQTKKIDIRFYEAIPAVRGIICEYHTNDRISYLTSYYWPSPNHSKAFDFVYVIQDSSILPRPETTLLESWINQYWGRDEIHTIVFDFDDTLVSTGEIQVKAWAQAIEIFLRDGRISINNLSSSLQKFFDHADMTIDKSGLLNSISAIFIDKQMAEAIIQELFVNLNDETIEQINKKRFEIRESMMGQARLFDGVKELLDKLSTYYNFAIISSTDEEMISKYLAKKGLLEYFPVILGKKDPSSRFERENIHQKTSLLIKLSEIIGIPLSRLVYIGDNNSDYLAAKQLRIGFIEARQAAKNMGKGSFIETVNPNISLIGYFDSFENDDLSFLLSQHSHNIAESKYQIQ